MKHSIEVREKHPTGGEFTPAQIEIELACTLFDQRFQAAVVADHGDAGAMMLRIEFVEPLGEIPGEYGRLPAPGYPADLMGMVPYHRASDFELFG